MLARGGIDFCLPCPRRSGLFRLVQLCRPLEKPEQSRPVGYEIAPQTEPRARASGDSQKDGGSSTTHPTPLEQSRPVGYEIAPQTEPPAQASGDSQRRMVGRVRPILRLWYEWSVPWNEASVPWSEASAPWRRNRPTRIAARLLRSARVVSIRAEPRKPADDRA
jgi:hypothetical protein